MGAQRAAGKPDHRVIDCQVRDAQAQGIDHVRGVSSQHAFARPAETKHDPAQHTEAARQYAAVQTRVGCGDSGGEHFDTHLAWTGDGCGLLTKLDHLRGP